MVFTRNCLQGNDVESARGLYEESYQGIYVYFTSIYLRGFYEERLSWYLRGNLATSLRGSFTWSLRRNIPLRFYDEIISSLCYDELARIYALRQTYNDETGFLANSS